MFESCIMSMRKAISKSKANSYSHINLLNVHYLNSQTDEVALFWLPYVIEVQKVFAFLVVIACGAEGGG